jgi:hypothetical protein
MAACNALVAAEEQAEREQEWQNEQQKEKEWQQEQQTEKEWQQEQQREQEWQQEQLKEKEWQQEQQKEKEWQKEQQTEKEWQQEQEMEKEWQQDQQKEQEWQQEQQTEKEKEGEPVSKRKPPPVRAPVVCGLGLQLEMAEMAELLYNRVGRFCFSLCICLYLYGDLAIYCTAVAKSIRDITCTPSEVGMQILYPLTSLCFVH